MEKKSAIQGFTLVEMVIVLSIVGLLIGGVLTGSNLARAAQMRRIETEKQRVVTAVRVFKNIYSALPGDMPNATSIWGALDPNPAVCKDTASTSAKTCNGDGNYRFEETAGSWEPFRFWQQLANAGLWEGQYTGAGVNNGPGIGYIPGTNVAVAPLDGAGWFLWYAGAKVGEAATTGWYDGVYGNVLTSVQIITPVTYQPLTPEEALNFDLKYDDGKPATGLIRVFAPAASALGCADSLVAATAAYNISVEEKACNPIFTNVF